MTPYSSHEEEVESHTEITEETVETTRHTEITEETVETTRHTEAPRPVEAVIEHEDKRKRKKKVRFAGPIRGPWG